MDVKSKFGVMVLFLLAGFVLFCSGWYLSRASWPEPYQINTARQPSPEDTAVPGETAVQQNGYPDSLLPGETIDINTADVYDLQRLPGIGEKRAMDIAAWREANGSFQSVDELTQVSGIGPVILEGLREYASVG